MSGHSDDAVAEESKRFFTFFNLSMILVAITGLEIVIIYVQSFEGSTIIGVLFATSIVKFIGVVWWFMHLRWDKILNTVLFLMGLVIALGTFFAVIFMADEHPVVEEFQVTKIDNNWKSGKSYKSGDFVGVNERYYQAISDHTADNNWTEKMWNEVSGIPHLISWKISTADLIEINSKKPENPFYYQYNPAQQDGIVGNRVAILEQEGKTEDFRIKVRSEAFWVENN
jgi:cytochrome c oxidase subunit 4